jgi:hypothetical protein
MILVTELAAVPILSKADPDVLAHVAQAAADIRLGPGEYAAHETGWLPDEIARDPRGYVLTGEAVVKAGRWREGRDPYLLETSAPGIFACATFARAR